MGKYLGMKADLPFLQINNLLECLQNSAKAYASTEDLVTTCMYVDPKRLCLILILTLFVQLINAFMKSPTEKYRNPASKKNANPELRSLFRSSDWTRCLGISIGGQLRKKGKFPFYFIQYPGIFQFTRQAVKMQKKKTKLFENTNNFGTTFFFTF